MEEEDLVSQAGLRGFQSRKDHCLSKRDKSSAGRIDPRAVDICAAINDRPEYYTTSSCAGRCFMYRGDGIKSHHHFRITTTTDTTTSTRTLDNDNNNLTTSSSGHGYFARFRVSHDIIRDAERYFNVITLDPSNVDTYDASGGGDPVRTIGQYDHKLSGGGEQPSLSPVPFQEDKGEGAIWLRYEPFILHVMCRTLAAASALMAAARPSFKNVGLTSWKQGYGRYIVAIWGDEGLDMPLTPPSSHKNENFFLFMGREDWLAQLINERHVRNWNKIDRFVQGVRSMPSVVDDVNNITLQPNDTWTPNDHHPLLSLESSSSSSLENKKKGKKRYDVIGDVALLHALPVEEEREEIGKSIMERNRAIKVVAAQSQSLRGTERSLGEEGLTIIAGRHRSPLMTSHREYGIDCVVDLNHTFFSSRMGPERLRICNQVARGEHVLVLFSGVGMDALQIVGRTEATTVVAIELNPIAAECARRGHQLLQRNKKATTGAYQKLKIIEGDVLDIIPTLPQNSWDRIVAPRPKEGALDGDLALAANNGNGGGQVFLEALLPLLKHQGECHWYDFAADHEYPTCTRTQQTIQNVCSKFNNIQKMEVLHVAHVGSIAKRQLRICMDFRILRQQQPNTQSHQP